MAKKETRFIKVLEEGGFLGSSEVWVDTQTGVQYLYHCADNSGGMWSCRPTKFYRRLSVGRGDLTPPHTNTKRPPTTKKGDPLCYPICFSGRAFIC